MVTDQYSAVQANDRFFELVQYTPEEIIGYDALTFLIEPEDLPRAREYFIGESTNVFELGLIEKDGTKFTAELLTRKSINEGK